jgi:hypothetical protein
MASPAHQSPLPRRRTPGRRPPVFRRRSPGVLPVRPGGPSPPRGPVVEAQPPVAERLGYPDALRDADVATLFSMALPGLVAMAGMTALGGALGYRQARAGYLLRAAGAGRFLP